MKYQETKALQIKRYEKLTYNHWHVNTFSEVICHSSGKSEFQQFMYRYKKGIKR